ncbi:MAG: hypothetical protein ABWX73_08320 [Marmoricola sp.]
MSTSQLDAMIAESGLVGPAAEELASVLSPLALLSDEAAPTPSVELAQLFAGDAPVRTTSPEERRSIPRLRGKHRTRGAVAGVVVLALSGVGATGLSAAANTLPAPWQHGVAGFSRHYLPFDFPEPADRQRQPFSQDPDSARAVRGGERVPGGQRAAAPEVSRSASRAEFAAHGAPVWRGRDPRPSVERPGQAAQSSGYALPRGPGWHHHAVAPTTQSGSEERPSQLAPGDDDDRDRDRSRSGGDRPSERPSEEPPKNGTNGGDADRGDRPVRGGGIGGPKDTQKGPQQGPQPGPQKTPQRGPLPGKPGGGGDDPDEPTETPSDRDSGDRGSTGHDQAPPDPRDPDDRPPDSLSGLTEGARTLLEGGTG